MCNALFEDVMKNIFVTEYGVQKYFQQPWNTSAEAPLIPASFFNFAKSILTRGFNGTITLAVSDFFIETKRGFPNPATPPPII